MERHVRDTDFKAAMETVGRGSFIDGDILLSDDIAKIPMATGPRRMTFIMLALCTAGSARYTVDTREQEVKAGDIIIITERHVVDNYCPSADIAGLCIMMSAGFFYEMVHNISEVSSLILFSRNNPVVSVTEREAEVFKSYFHIIQRKTMETDNHYRRHVVLSLALAMLYDLSNIIYRLRFESGRWTSRYEELFTIFIRLVEENFRRERRVSWYAKQMGLSAKYLSEAIRQASQRTPNGWIDSYVSLEIRLQLRNTRKSIKQIAEEMNFPSQSFLGKYFKDNVGMSPSEYRRS